MQRAKLPPFARILSLAVLFFGVGSWGSAHALNLGFASEPFASILFTPIAGGASFTFGNEVPLSFDDFEITNSDGAGDSVGLTGDLDGTFSYTTASITSPLGGIEIAPVTGSGTMSIDDGVGFIWTADLVWIDIRTFTNVGSTNTFGVINLTGISYGGANADLSVLATAAGIISTSFTFLAPFPDLTSLATSGGTVNNFSGAITPIPEPGSAALLGVGLAVAAGGTRRRAVWRKTQNPVGRKAGYRQKRKGLWSDRPLAAS